MFATLETNQGNIKIQLYPDKAPKTVENFVGLEKARKSGPIPLRARRKRSRFIMGRSFTA